MRALLLGRGVWRLGGRHLARGRSLHTAGPVAEALRAVSGIITHLPVIRPASGLPPIARRRFNSGTRASAGSAEVSVERVDMEASPRLSEAAGGARLASDLACDLGMHMRAPARSKNADTSSHANSAGYAPGCSCGHPTSKCRYHSTTRPRAGHPQQLSGGPAAGAGGSGAGAGCGARGAAVHMLVGLI